MQKNRRTTKQEQQEQQQEEQQAKINNNNNIKKQQGQEQQEPQEQGKCKPFLGAGTGVPVATGCLGGGAFCCSGTRCLGCSNAMTRSGTNAATVE